MFKYLVLSTPKLIPRASFLLLFTIPTIALGGVLSKNDDAADNALVACIRQHPIKGEAVHQNQEALDDFEKRKKLCSSELRALMDECLTSRRFDRDGCAWGIASFLNSIVENFGDKIGS